VSVIDVDNDKQADDIVDRLKTRAEIRRSISTRKSVQEGQPDRIADIHEEAAAVIEQLRTQIIVDQRSA